MRTLKKKDVRIKLRLASSSVATVEQKSDIKRCCRAALYCKSTVYMVLLNRILCFATDNRFQITSVQKIHCLEILIKKKKQLLIWRSMWPCLWSLRPVSCMRRRKWWMEGVMRSCVSITAIKPVTQILLEPLVRSYSDYLR